MGKRRTAPTLDLHAAGAKHPIDPSLWTTWADAAAVTLERFHQPPSSKGVVHRRGTAKRSVALKWKATTKTIRDSHANEIDATEMGVYAIASAALGELEGWQVVKRAQHGSGADLIMLAPDAGDDEDLFVRLEASGMAAGANDGARKELKARLNVKVAQLLKPEDEEAPGVAAVFGYELALLMIAPAVK